MSLTAKNLPPHFSLLSCKLLVGLNSKISVINFDHISVFSLSPENISLVPPWIPKVFGNTIWRSSPSKKPLFGWKVWFFRQIELHGDPSRTEALRVFSARKNQPRWMRSSVSHRSTLEKQYRPRMGEASLWLLRQALAPIWINWNGIKLKPSSRSVLDLHPHKFLPAFINLSKLDQEKLLGLLSRAVSLHRHEKQMTL